MQHVQYLSKMNKSTIYKVNVKGNQWSLLNWIVNHGNRELIWTTAEPFTAPCEVFLTLRIWSNLKTTSEDQTRYGWKKSTHFTFRLDDRDKCPLPCHKHAGIYTDLHINTSEVWPHTHTFVLSQTLILTLTLSPSCSREHAQTPWWWHNIKWMCNPRLHIAQHTNKGLRKCSSGPELLFTHGTQAFTWIQGSDKCLQCTHRHTHTLEEN